MTTNEKNIATIQDCYAAFGRGDIPALLARLAQDVEWHIETESRDVAWWQRYRGRADVARFFVALDAEAEFTQFEPRSFAVATDEIVARVDWAARHKRTGKTMAQTSLHRFAFNAAGEIARWIASEDTAATRDFVRSGQSEHTLRRFGGQWMDALDRRDLSALQRLCAPGFKMIGLAPEVLDAAGTAAAMAGMFECFPDSRMPIDNLLVGADSVAIVHRFEGTHRAPFEGLAPTGTRVSAPATIVVTLRDGLAIEGRLHVDRLGMMQQLGGLPAR